MKTVILSLVIALSLMVVPAAHAAGMLDDGCHSMHSEKKDSKSEGIAKKIAGVGHHCGASAMSLRLDAKSYEPVAQSSSAPVISGDVHMASVIIGPLLKPPSYL